MKITIVGKGLAGSLAVSHLCKYLPGHEIEWVFDPNIDTQSVGEGSILTLPRSLFEIFGFSLFSDLPKIDGTIKTGIYKKNWNNSEAFFHDFPLPNVALHFNAKKLQDFIFRKMERKVNIRQEHITNSDIDSDFIFDCTGSPKDIDNNFFESSAPVNSVYINQCHWDKPRFNYTLTIARPYGWVFGIPLADRCSVGYLYNNQINSVDEIKADMQSILDDFELEPSKNTSSFGFNSYYRRENFTNRIGYNGNASFFIEPLEALSTGIIDYVNRSMFDIIVGNITYKDANERFLKNITETENVIMLHYLNQSLFNTEFWDFAKERAIKCLQPRLKNDQSFLQLYNETRNIMNDSFLQIHKNLPEYGHWWQGSFVTNFRGMNIYPIIDDIIQN